MNVNLFFNWLWIGELLTFKTGPCILQYVSLLLQNRGTFIQSGNFKISFRNKIVTYTLRTKNEWYIWHGGERGASTGKTIVQKVSFQFCGVAQDFRWHYWGVATECLEISLVVEDGQVVW